MNFLTEATTVGLLLLLFFGALFFYLYSSISYVEKRMALMENILLDIRMSLDHTEKGELEYIPEPVGSPQPLEKSEVEEIEASSSTEDHLYKSILEEAHKQTEVTTTEEEEIEDGSEEQALPSPVKKSVVTPNYESMLKSELATLCEQRNLKVGKRPGRAELIAALRKYDEGTSGTTATSEFFPMGGNGLDKDEGFPVDLGAESLE